LLTITDKSWQPRAREHLCDVTQQVLRTPMVWLCHNLRNRVLFAQHSSLRRAPVLVSLGDAFLRPSYKDRFFTEKLRETLGLRGPIMVDSGGFALMRRRHLRWSMKEIERLYSRLRADILVSLDFPPSPDDDRLTRGQLRKKSLQNLRRMRDFVPADRLMPVVHGYSLGELERSCYGVRDICSEVKQIGIGGLVPLICSGGLVRQFGYVRKDGTKGDRGMWISDALRLVRQMFPEAFVHVFGIGSATTAIGVLSLGADSVDSFSWRRVANYGAILLPGCSERFPMAREGRVRSRPVVSREEFSLLMKCKCPACMEVMNVKKRLEVLAGSYSSRAVHNAWTVLSEVAKFRNAIQQNRTREFLTSRLTPAHRLYHPVFERWCALQ
jgi:7-cyano-7-deazaguanine tRNA-ribosyltransferase